MDRCAFQSYRVLANCPDQASLIFAYTLQLFMHTSISRARYIRSRCYRAEYFSIVRSCARTRARSRRPEAEYAKRAVQSAVTINRASLVKCVFSIHDLFRIHIRLRRDEHYVSPRDISPPRRHFLLIPANIFIVQIPLGENISPRDLSFFFSSAPSPTNSRAPHRCLHICAHTHTRTHTCTHTRRTTAFFVLPRRATVTRKYLTLPFARAAHPPIPNIFFFISLPPPVRRPSFPIYFCPERVGGRSRASTRRWITEYPRVAIRES